MTGAAFVGRDAAHHTAAGSRCRWRAVNGQRPAVSVTLSRPDVDAVALAHPPPVPERPQQQTAEHGVAHDRRHDQHAFDRRSRPSRGAAAFPASRTRPTRRSSAGASAAAPAGLPRRLRNARRRHPSRGPPWRGPEKISGRSRNSDSRNTTPIVPDASDSRISSVRALPPSAIPRIDSAMPSSTMAATASTRRERMNSTIDQMIGGTADAYSAPVSPKDGCAAR